MQGQTEFGQGAFEAYQGIWLLTWDAAPWTGTPLLASAPPAASVAAGCGTSGSGSSSRSLF